MRRPFTGALVTGASSGIGEAFARRLGRAGIPTTIVARRGERLDDLAAEYPSLRPLAVDLTTGDGMRAVEELVASERDIDLVVNNAGFGTSGPFLDADRNRLEREVLLNVTALTRISHAAVTAMSLRGRGYVLNVSSIASFQPGPHLAVYAATKAYVTSLSTALHEELRGSGVRVCVLCPGLTRTEFQSVSRQSGAPTEYPEFMWMTADAVARAGLRAVRNGRAVCTPGAVNKVLVAATDLMPRAVVQRLSGVMMKMR
ncbi:MAG: SDR family NAD(P)-dependent oxidoreductase [Ilumatobacteraceae bacterium]